MCPCYTRAHHEELGIFDRVQTGHMERGQFIDYHKIESALLEHLEVLEVGVVTVKNPPASTLCVYLVLTRLQEEQAEFWRRHVECFIHSKFQLNMPILIRTCEKLPVTKSGKLSRSALENWN